jgi:hypothetical protein
MILFFSLNVFSLNRVHFVKYKVPLILAPFSSSFSSFLVLDKRLDATTKQFGPDCFGAKKIKEIVTFFWSAEFYLKHKLVSTNTNLAFLQHLIQSYSNIRST